MRKPSTVWVGLLAAFAAFFGCRRAGAQSSETIVIVTSGESSSGAAQPEALQSTPSQNPGGDSRYAGLTLRQRQLAENEDRNFQGNIDYYVQSCRAPVDARIEWASFAGALDRSIDGQESFSFTLFCAYPLDHLASLCTRSETDRQAVVSRVSSYRCSLGGPGRRALAMSGGAVHMSVDWSAPDYTTFVTDYFGRNL